ncbi:uncharacterized protein LOC144631796 [Oculina patagonica]
MAESMEVDDFPVDLPKYNRYSYAVVKRCKGRLLEDQWDALERLRKWFNRDDPQNAPIALVCMPTGSGKTGIICCLPYFLGTEGLEDVPRSFPTGDPRHFFDKPVLVITPNLNISDHLEEQMLISPSDTSGRNFLLRHGIVQDNQRRALPSGVKIEETEKLNGPNSANFLRGKEVIIANAQKFLKKEKWEVDLPDDLFKLVIVDEAHHFPARTWTRIIKKFEGHALVVFFTATPYRGDKKPVVKTQLAYHLPLKRAVKGRIIRDTNFVEETTFTLPAHLQFKSEPTPEELLEWKAFYAILKKVREIQERKDKDSPLPNNVPHMAFAITKEQYYANRVAELWKACWKDAPAITYHSENKSELPERMKQIRNNRVRLVVVVDMLQEGFDHPPVSIAAIMTKITSPVKFVQFIGRAQRIARGPEGKESSEIAADVVTHSHFEQRENYRKFDKEELLVIED